MLGKRAQQLEFGGCEWYTAAVLVNLSPLEVERYIAIPGQALAYKTGELKFKELRAFATKELGSKFDVRLFHDQVLKNGAVPLTLLDEQVRAWVAEQKKL